MIVKQNKTKKKTQERIYQVVDLAVPIDHWVKSKENEKNNKYLDLAIKLWNMKVTVIPIETGALGTVTKGLAERLEDLEIRGWVKTIQTTALLRLARILRRLAVTQTPVRNHQLRLVWK